MCHYSSFLKGPLFKIFRTDAQLGCIILFYISPLTGHFFGQKCYRVSDRFSGWSPLVFLVCSHVTRRPCWGSKQYKFSRRIYMNKDLVPREEKCFFSGPPPRPPLRHVQTSNEIPLGFKITQQYLQCP